MLVESFHSLKHHVAPLSCFVRIGFALHEDIKEPRAASFQADNWIGDVMIGFG